MYNCKQCSYIVNLKVFNIQNNNIKLCCLQGFNLQKVYNIFMLSTGASTKGNDSEVFILMGFFYAYQAEFCYNAESVKVIYWSCINCSDSEN